MSEVDENLWDIMNHSERVYMSTRVKKYSDDLLRIKISYTSERIKELEDIYDRYEHLTPRDRYAPIVELCFLYGDLKELTHEAKKRKLM